MKFYTQIILLAIIFCFGVSNLKAQNNGAIGNSGAYFGVLKIGSLDSSPAYFYIDTNIPARNEFAPQLQITGYTYGASNKAMKVTLGWYHWQNNFYWSQYFSEIGYQKPSRIRLGKYLKNGIYCIRIEISNNSVYWSNYSISATDIGDKLAYYNGWTYLEGEMPTATTIEIIEVQQPNNIFIDSNVGIGIATPGEKLAVNGKIRAKEIRVEASGWPDYVFDEDYKVLELGELEKYIKTNRHLPEMPSAQEVGKNGVELGELTKTLLKKIEELSLLLIEQNKKIEQYEERFLKLERNKKP